MIRTITDNPSGWSRNLPGHTVEYDENYGLPWSDLHEESLLTTASYSYDLVIPDDDYIYFVDMVGCTPKAYTAFRVRIKLNTVTYVNAAFTGWCNIPLRQNPSLQFIYGDTINFSITNDDASTRTLQLICNGTKIPKPAGYAHGAF